MTIRLRRVARQWGLGVLSLFVVVVIWQFAAVVIVKNKVLLPCFSDVFLSFLKVITNVPVFVTDLSVSLNHFAIGLAAALILGIPIGIIMGWFEIANRLIDPIVEIIRPIPPIAWIPFAITWLGFKPVSAGFLIFIGAVFPIIINTFTGFKSIPLVYVEAAKVLGCTRERDLIRYVALPSAMPSIAAGVRIAMGVGWMCLVAAEMFGVSTNGLGYKLWWHYDIHRMDFVIVYMLLLGFLGFFIDKIFRFCVDYILLKWRKGVTV